MIYIHSLIDKRIVYLDDLHSWLNIQFIFWHKTRHILMKECQWSDAWHIRCWSFSWHFLEQYLTTKQTGQGFSSIGARAEQLLQKSLMFWTHGVLLFLFVHSSSSGAFSQDRVLVQLVCELSSCYRNHWCSEPMVFLCSHLYTVVLSLFVKHLASSEMDDNRLLKF